MRTIHWVAVLILCLAASGSAAPQAPNSSRPNIVLIMTDDAGYGDTAVYGAPDIRTPHIDSLARDGVRLTDFYANGATCTPTRTGLISGRYQQRFVLEAPLGSRGKADWVSGYMTDLITDKSIHFIEQNSSRPFFIDVAYNAPHWPYQTPHHPSTARDHARHLGPFDEPTSTRADYVAMMEHVDSSIGRILATLDRLGLSQNTLVIFTNDNGGEWLSRNMPMFHHKGSVWEGGIRVPAIMRWPSRIPAGRVSDQVGITMDLTATILAATGTPVPQEARHEGTNLLPVLEGRTPRIERTLFWRVLGDSPQHAVRSGDWKFVRDGGRLLLFNLKSDVGERENLLPQHPDIARRLQTALTAWQADVDSEAKRQAKAVK